MDVHDPGETQDTTIWTLEAKIQVLLARKWEVESTAYGLKIKIWKLRSNKNAKDYEDIVANMEHDNIVWPES